MSKFVRLRENKRKRERGKINRRVKEVRRG